MTAPPHKPARLPHLPGQPRGSWSRDFICDRKLIARPPRSALRQRRVGQVVQPRRLPGHEGKSEIAFERLVEVAQIVSSQGFISKADHLRVNSEWPEQPGQLVWQQWSAIVVATPGE